MTWLVTESGERIGTETARQDVLIEGLWFTDASGLNPLPPGILVVLMASPANPFLDPNQVTQEELLLAENSLFVGAAYTQPGGSCPLVIGPGIFEAAFLGTQGPLQNVRFVSSGPSAFVQCANYASPSYLAAGYAAEAAYALPKGWFLDETGTGTYPNNIDQTTYAVLLGLAKSQGINDQALQEVLGAMRLATSQGKSVDSWARDFFGGTFYRFAQYDETDAQFIARILAIFATDKSTQPGMQTIVNVFWPWVLLELGIGGGGGGGISLSGGIPAGLVLGEDVVGGEDVGTTFEDAPSPTTQLLAPVPVVFDQQTNPTLAGLLAFDVPKFCVYLKYNPNPDSLIQLIAAPSAILSQLVGVWKAPGTVPLYADNKGSH